MKVSRASKTAEQMALSRAIETRKPPAERICDDAFAERFLSAKYKLLLLGRPLRDGVERLIESMFAGHHYYVVARTRYFDAFLEAQLAHPMEQLVILGAGFDSRAYRFANALRDLAVFEVDHPATSASKKARVREILNQQIPANVTFVPVDFNVEGLDDKLRAGGYRDQGRTIFLWEGVTPYLTAAAVDDTLGFIRSSGAPGSVVLFDYILDSVVDGSCSLPGARNEFEKMQRTSEPLTFGLAQRGIVPFLAARGFRDVVDLGTQDLKDRYFRGPNRDRCVKPWWRIAHATIA